MRPIEVVALAKNVVAKMTDNATFPTPLIALATLEAKTEEADVAIELATEGSKLDRLTRDQVLAELGTLLSMQADYVRSICDGDRLLLASSGYELVKEREPVGIPGTTIIKEVVTTGVTGQVAIKWSRVRGATVYQVWMTDGDPNDAKSWQPLAATHRVSLIVDDLKSLSNYWFTISAIGAAGEGAKSDPAKGIAA